MKRSSLWPLGLSFALFCAQGFAAPRQWNHPEETAVMSYDLGPAAIDVSKYPPTQRENYQLFLEKCSRCHSPARPINSPITLESDWRRFVSLMHSRSRKRFLTRDEGRRIIDFLAYDSQIRKVQDKKAFDELQRQLNARFEELQKERARKVMKIKPKEPTPYTGAP